jgi:hypothetical protein
VAWEPSACATGDAPIGFDAKAQAKPDRMATVTIPTASGSRVNRIELIFIDTALCAMDVLVDISQ